MSVFFRVLCYSLLLLLTNITIIISLCGLDSNLTMILIIVSTVLFLFFNINPSIKSRHNKRIKALIDGHMLLTATVILLVLEPWVYLVVVLFSKSGVRHKTLIANALVFLILVFILMCNGLIRITIVSKQLGLIRRILLFFTWWIPLINLVLFIQCLSAVRREYIFEIAKEELYQTRKDTETCKTRYPVLLIHGIFWRDWQIFNYWGRIPKELIRNGAVIYYGNHQSAANMEDGAKELKEQILNIISKENCEKVNIIAHSKGGLDARYAVGCLGIEEYVASLTTVCTPHLGSELVDSLLKMFSGKAVCCIAKKYNSLYKKLGDRQPDFLSGVFDLTTEKCAQFNIDVPNMPGVLYQSVSSKMSTASSAGFPLNVGYLVLKRRRKENDGFVSVDSSVWGNYLGCYETKQKHGVSHGDMIDLTRKNIQGFDVCECYVDILSGLKAQNL